MLTPFECFVLLLIWFHSSEFVLAAFFNYSILTWNSWLFSKPYVAAMAIAGLEYGLEVRYLPWMKARQLTVAGLWLACVGEVLRKAGMLTAQRNFTHKIQFHRRHGHTLVKHGIYSWCRHPGYLGWCIWAVATQMVLCNPVCIVVFTVVSWQFMRRRIEVEDRLLRRFFGAEWEEWRLAVPSGLPWIP